jgi:hypothetical protein
MPQHGTRWRTVTRSNDHGVGGPAPPAKGPSTASTRLGAREPTGRRAVRGFEGAVNCGVNRYMAFLAVYLRVSGTAVTAR